MQDAQRLYHTMALSRRVSAAAGATLARLSYRVRSLPRMARPQIRQKRLAATAAAAAAA